MRAGKLRTRLDIKNNPVTGQDAIGGETTTPATFVQWWCDLVRVQGGEVFKGRAVNAQANSLASGRFFAGVTPQMYAVLGSRTFDILGVENVNERSKEMRLELKERGL